MEHILRWQDGESKVEVVTTFPWTNVILIKKNVHNWFKNVHGWFIMIASIIQPIKEWK